MHYHLSIISGRPPSEVSIRGSFPEIIKTLQEKQIDLNITENMLAGCPLYIQTGNGRRITLKQVPLSPLEAQVGLGIISMGQNPCKQLAKIEESI